MNSYVIFNFIKDCKTGDALSYIYSCSTWKQNWPRILSHLPHTQHTRPMLRELQETVRSQSPSQFTLGRWTCPWAGTEARCWRDGFSSWQNRPCLKKHAGTHTRKGAESLCFIWILSWAGQVLPIKRCYLMDDAGSDRPVILLPKNVIYSYPRTPLRVPKCIFKSFPFTRTCLRLARIFNMPVRLPCHLRRSITAKRPWKKSLEYKCSQLRESNLISELQLRTGHTGERFNGCAERKQHLLPSQQKPSSKKGKRSKNNPVKQHAVRQQIMKQWIIDFLRNCYFILIL